MVTVALDAVGAGATGSTTAGISWSHTITGSALVVAIGGFNNNSSYTALTTHTVKVGTTPLVQLGIVGANNDPSKSGWTELWGLINPPTGAQTIAVVENVSTNATNLYANSVSYTNVSRFGTPVTHTGSSSSLSSGSIVSATGSMVVSAQGVYNDTLTISGSGTSRYKQPTVANANNVTLLVQDVPGAATVSLTSTNTSNSDWAVVSVNLVAGNQWTVNAAKALTVTSSAAASTTAAAWTIGASLALTVTRTATATDTPLGPPLRYVGRLPDNLGVLTPVAYAKSAYAASTVTPTYIDSQVATAAQNLVNQAYINQQVANYTTQATVTAALAGFIPNTSLGAVSGIAQLNGSSQIPTAQLTTPLVVNSLAVNYDAVTSGTVFLAPATTHTVTSQIIGEFVIAKVTVPDPGYPWIPWPFAYVLGSSGGTPSGSRLAGNGNSGLLAVTPLGATLPLYAAGLMTDDPLPNYYAAIPYGAVTGPMTPTTQPPIIGSLTLQLSACCWTGGAYTVNGTGLVFYILVLPGL